MTCTISKEEIRAAEEFHGHTCPGLAIGIRAVELALRELGPEKKEDLLVVTETDMCGVDAIQALLSCTYGKGNLIHRDYGKMAFSFYDSASAKGVRVALRPGATGMDSPEAGKILRAAARNTATEEEKRLCLELRRRAQDRCMTLPLEEMFDFGPPPTPAPRSARILSSLVCADCGEGVMESRTRRFDGRTLCIPCFARVEQKV